ncbi:carbohydrate ABC transporter permease [Elusimicrobiota bacterium]
MRKLGPYFFLIPAALAILLFLFVPLASSLNTKQFLLIERVLKDSGFWNTLLQTSLFTAITVPLEILIGLGFALLLNQAFPGRGVVRAIVILPWALPTAIMAISWKWIFNDQYGIFSHVVCSLGLSSEPIALLATPLGAFSAIVVADVWKTAPFVFILLLAGLQSVPKELLEAAEVDGANAWKKFWLAVFPYLKPYLFVALVFRIFHTFGVFDLVWVLTGGGPANKTRVFALYIYESLFRYLELDYAMALNLVFMVILLIATTVLLWLFREKEA